VVDYFALLGQERRPLVDPAELKQRLLAFSQEHHPDRTHAGSAAERQQSQDHFTSLNSAYQTLLDPKARLAHLLELENGGRPAAIQSAPADLMNLFMEVGTACKKADPFLEEKRRVTSPLLQVELFGRGQVLTAALQKLLQEVQTRLAKAQADLTALDLAWSAPNAAKKDLIPKLEESYRTFSYLSRWSAQLQERIVQLAL